MRPAASPYFDLYSASIPLVWLLGAEKVTERVHIPHAI